MLARISNLLDVDVETDEVYAQMTLRLLSLEEQKRSISSSRLGFPEQTTRKLFLLNIDCKCC
ncbi:hypothetical protein HanPSC8_Chr00c041g0802891 [Helianthus annuus]|nr:hypothetical protein HanPSC8_Chr00c041g0802891 [Helianthus annuus]